MKYKYIHLQGGRGIVIELDMIELINMPILDIDKLITDEIYLRLNMNDDIVRANLEDINRFATLAIQHLSGKIKSVLQKAPVYYYIQSLNFNTAHYQREGLYCVIFGWLKEYYKIEVPEIKIKLDRNANKYIFSFPI